MTLAITVREAKTALAQIKKLTPARPRLDDEAKLSLKEVVFLMAPELAAMTKRGFTLKELADGLQAQSIPIKPATLNRYLNEYKAGQIETGTGLETPKEKIKEPTANSAAKAAQEPAEAAETSDAESKAEETSQAEGASLLSETTREKSENSPSHTRMLFQKEQEENPLEPPNENLSEFLM